MKKEFWPMVGWIALAFMIGASLHIGHKTVDYFWPDEITKMEVTHKTEAGYEIK